MRASIKLLIAGLAALFAVLVALLFLVDANFYRTQIEQRVSTAFGREIILEGPLSLEPSFTPRFTVNGLKIANPDWASRPFLAAVDKFDIRVSLFPLLRGDLQIVSLEFHGVDLLLEKAPGGANNFTFSESSDPAGIPAIEHMSLYDVAIAYAAPESPVKRLHVEELTASKIPGRPVIIEAQTRVNTVPVTFTLRGEPQDTAHLEGPWQLILSGDADDLSLHVESGIVDPTDWSQGDYQLAIKGQSLDVLETLSGATLPDAGPFKLAAKLRFKLDEYLAVNDLSGRLGNSDIQGNLHWDFGTSRSAVTIRLASQQLDAGELSIGDPQTPGTVDSDIAYLDQPIDFGQLDVDELDVEINIQNLNGLEKPVRDIVLTSQANQQQLQLEVVKATVDHTHVTANMVLPWGKRLTTSSPEAFSLKTLLQQAELDIHAQAPDSLYQYATSLMERPLDFTLSAVKATARPDTPLTITAEAALNGKPVAMRLQGEPLAALVQRPTGPWQTLALEIRGDDIHLDATGSVARPFETTGFDISYTLSGADINTLLPLQGAWSLSGQYADHPNRNAFDQLKVRLGRSDIAGRVLIYQDAQRPRLVANLNARRILLDEILPESNVKTAAEADWDQPLNISGMATFDLDVDARIQQLDGLAKPMRDIRLDAHADGQTLTLAPLRGTVDGIEIDARVHLPWGERLVTPGEDGISIPQLMQQADVALAAQPPNGKLQFQTTIAGQAVDLGLTTFEASARPGKALHISAKALLDDKSVQANLRAEPLAELLQRPSGPWRDLKLEMRADDIRFEASGSVAQPFEAKGFDIRYALRGAEIDTLLPLFNLILPLEGAYSLTGQFADLPDGFVFDQLKIQSGSNDISGNIRLYDDKPRPRVVAKLESDQFYLGNLLPVSNTETAADTAHLVIPDYTLPVERMREIDGELEFKGQRLRTTAGDLGDISFKATLKDGVFRMDPFSVRGWAGAFVESHGMIDTSQEPPLIKWNWIGRQLNYGELLEKAGFAETVEGTIDVTLRLSGEGRTRREFLGDADGQLIIVGQEGRFGSRRLDLWGSALVTTMLSREWHSEDVTDLNCVVARIGIEDGVASSDKFIIDTQRITIAATGTLDLETETLNLIVAPRPKRATLVALTSPVHVSGTLAAPEVAVTVLPRNRMAAAGTGMLAGLINPGYLIFAFSQTGAGQANSCETAVAETMALKTGTQDQTDDIPTKPARRFSLLPGCTQTVRTQPDQ